MKPEKYKARLIQNGKVINNSIFEALPHEAFAKAHDGIPFGSWVELTQVTDRNKSKLNGNNS